MHRFRFPESGVKSRVRNSSLPNSPGIYKLDVVEIPTNRPIARKDMNDRVYKTQREKYKAVIEEIEMLIKAGRPVLVGTTSVEISEMLSKMLQMRKIPHNVLNANCTSKRPTSWRRRDRAAR